MNQETKSNILLYCLGIGTRNINASELEELSVSDWNEIFKESIKHRVTPILYQRFNTSKTTLNIPDEIMKQLNRVYFSIIRENMKIYNELAKALRAAKEEDIPIIVLKGAALAELVYQNIALRPMNDVDIVVRSHDAWNIDKILTPLGYKSDALSAHHAQRLPHIAKSSFLEIDINPRLYELPELDPWVNAKPVKLASADAFILGSEDFLIHVCLHLDRHYYEDGFTRLIWWYDIVELLKHYREGLNWDYIINLSREYDFEDSIKRVLTATKEWFNQHISDDVLAQLKNHDSKIFTGNFLYAPDKVRYNNELGSVISSLSDMPKFPSIKDKIHYLFRRMFPVKEQMIRHYSIKRGGLVYIYYLVRVFEIMFKGLKVLVKLPNYLKSKGKKYPSSF